jgi:hypothetical protein
MLSYELNKTQFKSWNEQTYFLSDLDYNKKKGNIGGKVRKSIKAMKMYFLSCLLHRILRKTWKTSSIVIKSFFEDSRIYYSCYIIVWYL